MNGYSLAHRQLMTSLWSRLDWEMVTGPRYYNQHHGLIGISIQDSMVIVQQALFNTDMVPLYKRRYGRGRWPEVEPMARKHCLIVKSFAQWRQQRMKQWISSVIIKRSYITATYCSYLEAICPLVYIWMQGELCSQFVSRHPPPKKLPIYWK